MSTSKTSLLNRFRSYWLWIAIGGWQLLRHSDRGCQYTSEAHQRILQSLRIECSMSRTDNCYDNPAIERFFRSLKHEWNNHEQFQDLQDSRLSVFNYIETFYNPASLHRALRYQSTVQHEADHAPAVAA